MPKGRVEQQAKQHDSHSRGGFPGVTDEVVKFIAARKCVAQGKLRELVEQKILNPARIQGRDKRQTFLGWRI